MGCNTGVLLFLYLMDLGDDVDLLGDGGDLLGDGGDPLSDGLFNVFQNFSTCWVFHTRCISVFSI